MTQQGSNYLQEVKRGVEYGLVKRFYGTGKAERSQVPLINHINEGLAIMDHIGASIAAMQAYCLHPLFQNDNELSSDGVAAALTPGVNPYAILLVMEYRQRANAWLSDKVTLRMGMPDFNGSPDWGLLAPVKQMLIADKVQNRKDFITYHRDTHARSIELDCYFERWLQVLDVSKLRYKELVDVANSAGG
jgi:hypothetical protein